MNVDTVDEKAFKIFEGRIVKTEQIEALSKLPGKQELRATLVGLIQSPMSKLVGVLQAPMRNVIGVLKALEDKEKQ